VESIAARFTDRTKLLVVDHITSATATVFPVARIAKAARDANIAVLVDGAHAPGQVAVDVKAIGADWYTGNAHKWLFAPKACGVLWTAPSRQSQTLPAVLSHGTPDGYRAAFDWIGTRDVTPWLCFEAAARQHDAFGGGDLLHRNKNLADAAVQLIAKRRPGRAAPQSLRAAMAAISLGPLATSGDAVNTLRASLMRKFGLVVPVFGFAGDLWLRISAQIYNEMNDYVLLADGLAYFLDGAESR
jgi:isopenicillin-N epimerase